MKLLLTFLITAFGLLENSFSQSCVDSSSRFLLQAGSSRILIKDNEVLADSSVIIAGNIRDANSSESYLFISRLDKHNNILFSKKLVGFTGNVKKMLECANGDILIAATSLNAFVQTSWLFRFSNTGDIIWQKKVELNVFSYVYAAATLALYENSAGNIYFGVTANIETDQENNIVSGYYYIYKFDMAGNSIWKTTLIQNDNSTNNINAIEERAGTISVITQQYFYSAAHCTSTDPKSVSLLRLRADNGTYIDSKTYCLNFSSIGCISSWNSYRHSVTFMPDGRIIISGNIVACDDHRLFTLEMDAGFNVLNYYFYNYVVPYTLSNGQVCTNRYGQVSVYSRGYNSNNFLYATFNTNGTINRQRKLQLPAGTDNSTGFIGFAFRTPDNFLVFSNLTQAGDEVLQVMEFKGDNNGTADCTGKDTTFLTPAPHTLAPVSFILDTIRTESFSPQNSGFSNEDFTFQRIEICSSSSICDSLKINGVDSVCLDNPQQVFTAIRNPGCNKVAEWRIDTSAIVSMQTLNDTTVRVIFKKQWQGYIYAYSNSCNNLLDSFYVNVFSGQNTVYLGNDTSFCNPAILDAGHNFSSYQWQDNSTSRFYTVSGPGTYSVSTTDHCGHTYTDTIIFHPKKGSVYLGADTCISNFPYVITAEPGYKDYQWQNGSTGQQFPVTEPGLYYIATRNYCNEIYKDSIRIYKGIAPFSLGVDTFLCPGNIIHFRAPAGYYLYHWQDGSNADSLLATVMGKYYVTVTDFCGNAYTDTVEITKLNKKVDAGADISICKKESAQLTAKGNFTSYEWSPSYNINDPHLKTVTVHPEISTTYYIQAATNEGCITKDTIIVNVKDCPLTFYIPSAFTPNNDGKNDLFGPIIMAPTEKYEFCIYNRWGQRIFYSTDRQKGWNGKLGSIDQDSGSFAWTCRFKFYDKPAIFKTGTFILIR